MDDAIDLLSLDGPGSGAAGGAKNKEVEKHPERRFKAALAAYTEREMPRVKAENPGLRKNQMEQIIYKDFQKSADNPFNQANVLSYNATQDDVQGSKGEFSVIGCYRLELNFINLTFWFHSSETRSSRGTFEILNCVPFIVFNIIEFLFTISKKFISPTQPIVKYVMFRLS